MEEVKMFIRALVAAIAALFIAESAHAQEISLRLHTRVGAVDGPAALTRIGAVTVDSALNLYIAQPAEQVVRVFNRNGELVRTIGRRGDGPGEMRHITSIGLRHDTLWISDSRLRRMSMFSLTGRFHYSFQWQQAVLAPGSFLADGSIVPVWILEGNAQAPSAWPVTRMRRDGTVIDTIAMAAGPRNIMVQGRAISHPFPDTPLWEYFADGRGLVMVQRSAPSSAASASFGVTWMTESGRKIGAREVGYNPVSVPRATIDALRETYATRGAPADYLRDLDQALRQIRYLPPVTAVAAASADAVWVAREAQARQLRSWCRLTRDTQPIACVALPPGSRVVAADTAHVWVREIDDLGVEYVARYGFSRRSDSR
jgi:hypothetical protein